MTDARGAATRRRAAAHVLVDADDLVDGSAVPIAHEVEHHLQRVVRLADGATVSATDGAGRWVLTTVRHDRGGLVLEPVADAEFEERPDALRLATAIPKGDRIDWLVQKATELGVSEVTLLHTQRSVVRWNAERAAKQLARLQRIADEAVRQSRRVWRMTVAGPADATTILPGALVAEPGGRPISVDDELVVIGPEGGWTDDELALAGDRVDLGDAVLRTETAAITAAALAAAARR